MRWYARIIVKDFYGKCMDLLGSDSVQFIDGRLDRYNAFQSAKQKTRKFAERDKTVIGFVFSREPAFSVFLDRTDKLNIYDLSGNDTGKKIGDRL